MTADQNLKPTEVLTDASPERRGRTIVNLVIIVILLVAGASVSILAFEVFSGNLKIGIHFGFVSLNNVESNTGENFNESGVITSSIAGIQSVYKYEYVYYNSTNLLSVGTVAIPGSGGGIKIGIAEFWNNFDAMGFMEAFLSYWHNHGTPLKAPIINSAYGGFKYYYYYIYRENRPTDLYGLEQNYTQGFAMGYKGNFVFIIMDYLTPSSNFNALIEAQINAMS